MSSPNVTDHSPAAAPPPPPHPASLGRRSAALSDRHLSKLAIVYIRQSSAQQIFDHQESRERQYALVDYAATLGWPRERILVIDEDQGRSGRTVEQRPGFQRLLSEVTLDHVGLVLGLELSRLSRSSKDWYHLLEVCALFGTLLADQDGIYDANDTNDRLVLGLKGSMSEVELSTMRNRLERGKLHKAERGELILTVPCGYLKLPHGEVVLDPDEQVRATVQLIFDKFGELDCSATASRPTSAGSATWPISGSWRTTALGRKLPACLGLARPCCRACSSAGPVAGACTRPTGARPSPITSACGANWRARPVAASAPSSSTSC
jgi:DNA invertase Pin-like site-specific DNA recombinase